MESGSKVATIILLLTTIAAATLGSQTLGAEGDSVGQLSFWLHMPKSEFMTCESTWLYMFVSNDGEDSACLPISSYSSEEALHYAIALSLTRDADVAMYPQLNVGWMGRLAEPCYRLSPTDTIVFAIELSGKYGLSQVYGDYPACLPPGDYTVNARLLDHVSAAQLMFTVKPLDAEGDVLAREYMNVVKSRGGDYEDCLALDALLTRHPNHVLASRLANSLMLEYLHTGDSKRGIAMSREILNSYITGGDLRLALIQILKSQEADSQELLRRYAGSEVPVGLILRELMKE